MSARLRSLCFECTRFSIAHTPVYYSDWWSFSLPSKRFNWMLANVSRRWYIDNTLDVPAPLVVYDPAAAVTSDSGATRMFWLSSQSRDWKHRETCRFPYSTFISQAILILRGTNMWTSFVSPAEMQYFSRNVFGPEMQILQQQVPPRRRGRFPSSMSSSVNCFP